MAGITFLAGFFWLGFLATNLQFLVSGQVLQPPYFNIATGKNIVATSTCGEDIAGDSELFCKLTGNTGTDSLEDPTSSNLIQGQYCDVCEPARTGRNIKTAHPAFHAIDGTERWWQSPPLSRSLEYNEVNITIDFGQQFHVAYVIIKFANSPRPALWVLERSTDYGKTFTPWQYFANTDTNCNTFFGMRSLAPLTRDDQVICSTEYSKIVPLENGEIVVSLVNNRPSANNFSHAAVLQEWTKATNVRLQLMRTNTLLSHLLALARQDPTVTRRYYYSIKDISIGGRCVCNGHADVCATPVPGNPTRLQCSCRHNTCGEQCEYCCPGFVQKKWRPATIDDANECEPCNCHDHTDECEYDEEVARLRISLDIYGNYEGGGVCQNCQHNTEGINCEKCKAGYYRPRGVPRDSPNVCQPCDCDYFYSTGSCAEETGQCECRPEYAGVNCDRCADGYYGYPACRPCDCHRNGTRDGVCQVGGGQCPCKPNYVGLNCDRCAPGYYNFPECVPCACERIGSRDMTCDPESGQCQCRSNYGGRACEECQDGYYSYPACQGCFCDSFGTTEEVCDKTNGRCLCRDRYGGPRCMSCDIGYYNYPNCYECGCDTGSAHNGCSDSGQCPCLPNFSGRKCDVCATGYYRYPECIACNCDRQGSLTIGCDQLTGECNCRSNFHGPKCNECAEGFYNFPACEECKCDPAGVIAVPGEPLGGCGAATQGLCRCKEKVTGRTCDTCEPLYWNLQISNPAGCEECSCHRPGTVAGVGVCEGKSGQCMCKEQVDGRTCDECADGAFNLQENNVFGCEACGCDVGGASNHICDKTTGQCVCKPRINGRRCDSPLDVHFFPDLYHVKYEVEDGYGPRNKPVRFGFSEIDFPGYSWRGYAIMSALQPEVLVPVEITDASLYRIVIRYNSLNREAVTGYITVSPQVQSIAGEQSSAVVYNPGRDPQHVTVSGNNIIMPFVMDPGRWIVSLQAPENILLDYFVLLPSAYYEAPLLQERVTDACVAGTYQEACNKYTHPRLTLYPVAEGEQGFYDQNGRSTPTNTVRDRTILHDLGTDGMAKLDRNQPSLLVSLPVPRPGKYAVVIQYYGGSDRDTSLLSVSVQGNGNDRQNGVAAIPECTNLCRTVVLDGDSRVAEFDLSHNVVNIDIVQEGRPFDLAIDYVSIIPIGDFDMDYVTPAFECTHKKPSDECVGTPYLTPPGAKKWEVESNAYRPSQSSGRGILGEDITPNVDDPNTALYTLDGSGGVTSVEMRDILPDDGGPYVFVVHYYQPETVSYDAEFVVRGTPSYSGTFKAEYCPHVSGCRSVVTASDGSQVFDIGPLSRDVVINIPDDKSLWLDYVMAIPVSAYTPDVLTPQPIDRAGEFIKDCGKDGFYISPDSSGFCRDGVFSLTSDYNNGAMPCECSFTGSTSFSCEEFGGQCACKPNIIGRKCDRCKTGYYGFPDCQPCNCVTGICEEQTGECICPPNVGGPQCDQCLPQTFGYDPFIGCERCDCSLSGVRRGNGNCDLVTGQCNCKDNVAGRKCDVCSPGFFDYPQCVPCDCDLTGTTDEICDQTSSRCLCKENVEGRRCDRCKDGTFFLEARNPQGCTNCFCFGATRNCESTTRRVWSKVNVMEGWGVTNFRNGRVTESRKTVSVDVDGSGDDPFQPIYWVAPFEYLGNKLTAYGGVLEYTVTYSNLRGDVTTTPIRRPDLVLSGNNIELVYSAPNPPRAGNPLTVEVDMLESSFMHSIGSGQVSREELMMALAGLEKIHIRAQYETSIADASLSAVSLAVAKKKSNGEPADSVEECICPPSNTGLSCEECGAGYHRTETGPYLGLCIPCDCNGHSGECDPNTGKCLDCKHNTLGDHCEICETGYVGDATGGNPDDCKICSCPYAIESNNFATSCTFGRNGETTSCDCLPGYAGVRCDRCEDGYHGDPTAIGGSCEPCNCHGNLDPSYNGPMCDTLRGNCLSCRPGTTGDNCEKCAEGYYGDAVVAKECKECECHACGTNECDSVTGLCYCKLGVTGTRCNRCLPNFYGFDTCQGCLACGCGQASRIQQCDGITGQCECMPGVSGRQCRECLPGYWDYGPGGCQKCDCPDHLLCEQNTGKCICLPGAMGPMCDVCEDKFILTDVGCQPCDECVTVLVDDVAVMTSNVTDTIDSIRDVSVGVDAYRKLQKLNETAWDLRALLPGLGHHLPVQLEPKLDEIDELKKKADKIEKKSEKSQEKSKDSSDDAADTEERALEVEKLVEDAVKSARAAVDSAQKKAGEIGQNGNTDPEDLLKKARKIVREIEGRDFNDPENDAENELQNAIETLERVKNLKEEEGGLGDKFDEVSNNMDDLMDKFRELISESEQTDRVLDEVETFNELNKDPDYKKTMEEVQDRFKNADNDVETGRDLLDQAKDFLDDAEMAVQTTALESSKLDAGIAQLDPYVDLLKEQTEDLEPLVENATIHAQNLHRQAEELDALIADTRRFGENAVKAAKAYENIGIAITDAMAAANAAKAAADDAKDLSEGQVDRAGQSKKKSDKLKKKAKNSKDKVEGDLTDGLEDAKASVTEVDRLNTETDDGLKEIQDGIGTVPSDDLAAKARKATRDAENAKNKAQAALDEIRNIADELPDKKIQVAQIPDIIDATVRAMDRAESKLNKLKETLPKARMLMSDMTGQKERIMDTGMKAMGNLTELKDKIDRARDQANRIEVAMTFRRTTTVQLRSIPDTQETTTYTTMSIFFNTTEKNGFLTYLGGLGSGDDYMAMEIVKGTVRFYYDMGSGPAEIRSKKTVSDGKWHQALVERNGRMGKLVVKTDKEEDDVVTGESPETYAILDLPENSRFFIGGVPQENFQDLPPSLRENRFTGCIDGLEFMGQTVGLWNFAQATNADKGCQESSSLGAATQNIFRLLGGGSYIILEKGKRVSLYNSAAVVFEFKSFADEGLFFYAGKDKDYMAVELRNGQVLFHFELGGGPAQILSDDKYNDGEWVKVVARRVNNEGLLEIVRGDSKKSKQEQSPDSHKGLTTGDEMYIGGVPRSVKLPSAVTSKSYRGCFRGLQLGRVSKDNLNENSGSKGLYTGCKDLSARTLTLQGSASYMALEPVNVNKNCHIQCRFRTQEDTGLMIFAQKDDQSNTFSLSLVDGAVVAQTKSNGDTVDVTSSNRKYNDGYWHYVDFVKSGSKLSLTVDDTDKSVEAAKGKKKKTTTDSPLYFGGTPSSISIDTTLASTTKHFVGCISDVTINQKLQDFAINEGSSDVSLAGCSVVAEKVDTPEAGAIKKPSELVEPEVQRTTQPPVQEVTVGIVEGCSLPFTPRVIQDETERGTKFGNTVHSRHEYDTLIAPVRVRSDFTVDIKTEATNGLIFYIADERQTDFITLYIHNGLIVYAFNCGSGALTLGSENPYNDGQWHSVRFYRDNAFGELHIDEDLITSGTAPGKSRSINVTPPYYVGGIMKPEDAKHVPKEAQRSFEGCIRDFTAGGVDLGDPARTFDTHACTTNTEDGMFIGPGGGYMIWSDRFKVALDLEFSVKIKPRVLSGVILSVQSPRGDFLSLEMVDGNLMVSADNGAGEFKTDYVAPKNTHLCDGQWHDIKVIKAKNIVTLEVDGQFAGYKAGSDTSSSTDTNDALFIGGLPDGADHKGISTSESYVGCIRDLILGESSQAVNFNEASKIEGAVQLNSCPLS
ncbi:laminin subunit alpha-like [Ptychodera flava]|uniref:laminin subunit alpha-like n=1 Tax=Ptychodera flava TaxID=63121 RepID=UPI003969E8CA